MFIYSTHLFFKNTFGVSNNGFVLHLQTLISLIPLVRTHEPADRQIQNSGQWGDGAVVGALGAGRGPFPSLTVEVVTDKLSYFNTRRGVRVVEDITRENTKFKETRNVLRGL